MNLMWPLVVYAVGVVVAVVGMVVVSHLLGERHQERATGSPYESGIVPEGSARLRFSAQFYLVAMLFVIFDIEAVFIFAYAASFRSLGWAGFGGLVVFVGILVAGLVYEWRLGALDWGRRGGNGRRSQS